MRISDRVHKILYFVLSLLIAIVLWLYVDNEQGNSTTQTFSGIPIEFIGAEDTLPNRNLMLTGGGEATVDLRLSFPRTLTLDKEDIRVQVDLSGISGTGTFTRTLSIYYPDTVDSSQITEEYRSRSAVTVQISSLYSKTIPVSVNVVNNGVPEGFVYMGDLLSWEPSTLTLRGREEDVAPVVSARVELDLDGVTGTVQQEFGYTLLDSEGNAVPTDAIRVSEKLVAVTAPVYIIKELPLTVKFKYAPGSAEEYTQWELSEDSITVAGEAVSLENVEEISLGEVDLSQFLSSFEQRDFDIPIPAGCVNQSGITSTKLTVRFRGLDTKTLSVTNITAIGLAEGQSWSKVTNSVDVTLRGPAGELEDVTEEDVRIVLDLTDYGNGTVSVPAAVLVDGHNNEVGAIGSYSVTCKIS